MSLRAAELRVGGWHLVRYIKVGRSDEATRQVVAWARTKDAAYDQRNLILNATTNCPPNSTRAKAEIASVYKVEQI